MTTKNLTEDETRLRDMFAAHALNGLCSGDRPWEWRWSSIAQLAYKAADAMLEARKAELTN